ncbi:MAG TPA: hypothetical protein VD963_05130 [Phycisphaerales bacterium]|nr:hypothetical protein [Phycisphaerales bacterium]
MTSVPEPAAVRSAPARPHDAPPEARLGVVAGDRLCVGCGFNLAGQLIVREAHYRLLVARCPECGSLAALQEYPLLGKWAGRLASLFAAAWVLGLVLAAFLSALALSAMISEVSHAAMTRLASAFVERQSVWATEKLQVAASELPQAAGPQSPAPPAPTGPGLRADQLQMLADATMGPYTMINSAWSEQADLGAIHREAGGLRAEDWLAAREEVMVLALLCAVLGVFWSLALLHLRGKGQLVLALALTGLAALMLWPRSRASMMAMAGWMDARSFAATLYGGRALLLTLVTTCAALWLAVHLGRRAARLLVRAMLPPRLRGPLAFLWFADGLDYPPGRYRAPVPARAGAPGA